MPASVWFGFEIWGFGERLLSWFDSRLAWALNPAVPCTAEISRRIVILLCLRTLLLSVCAIMADSNSQTTVYANGNGQVAARVGIVFAVLAVVLVAMRLSTRLIILRSPGWDDALVVVAMVCEASFPINDETLANRRPLYSQCQLYWQLLRQSVRPSSHSQAGLRSRGN